MWSWREWFFHNWSLDLAVKDARASAGGGGTSASGGGSGVDVTIANLDRMAFPTTLELTWKDGTRQRIALPVETWLQSGVRTLHFPATQPLVAATIDPDHVLPDANRANNTWKAP